MRRAWDRSWSWVLVVISTALGCDEPPNRFPDGVAGGSSCAELGTCPPPDAGSGGAAGAAPGEGGAAGMSGGAGAAGDGGSGGSDAIPTVLMLLDVSSSMAQVEDGRRKWDLVLDALTSPTGAVTTYQDVVRLGLTTFTTVSESCPALREVEPETNNAEAVTESVQNLEFAEKSESPTGAALVAATERLADEPGPKFVVLITDGPPDTCEVFDPQCGQDPALKALQDAHRAGITTYVVGVGPDLQRDPEWPKFLQDAANAGAGAPVAPPTETYEQGCGTLLGGLEADYAEQGGETEAYLAPDVDLATILNTVFGKIVGDR